MTGTLYAGCGATYAALVAFIVLRTQPNPSRLPLVLAALVTVFWGIVGVALPSSELFGSFLGNIDLLRLAAWYGFALHLYRRFVTRKSTPGQAFAAIGLLIAIVVGGAMVTPSITANDQDFVFSAGVAVRLTLAICQLLLLENLFRNAAAEVRWNINLFCIALGALAIYDTLIWTDAGVFRHVSSALSEGRILATALVAPLMGLATARAQGWKPPALQISRTAAFYSASLVASGLLLMVLAGLGEVVRSFGTRWGAVVQIGLVCGGVIAIAVLLTSGTGQSHIRAALIDPFFAERYDYRREWLRCIETLSGSNSAVSLHIRVIRAVAQVVDSPAGVLFLRESRSGSFQWSGSWNMPAVVEQVPADHPLVRAVGVGEEIVVPDLAMLMPLPTDVLPEIRLAVPLPGKGALTGLVLVAPPRGPFALDQEVFALLRTVSREVTGYLVEQRAVRALSEAQQLRDFGKRFAFVAHDIKNVSAQLSLLLANAEHHMDNPDFHRDLLATISASVQRIDRLLRRLQEPSGSDGENPFAGKSWADEGRARVEPLAQLGPIVDICRQLHGTTVLLETDGRSDAAAMGPEAFDAVVTHLLNNAIEAAGRVAPVRIVLRHKSQQIQLDIVDRGPGMTPEFVRDELFRPFRTSKRDGSGIGAFQARELLREAGGDLIVISRLGEGTTMRLLLPLVDEGTSVSPAA